MPSITLGPLTLIEAIGRGSGGEVWRAIHRDLDHPVAVKLLTLQSATPKFRAEVRAFAALDHPNIVRLYDYGVVSREDAADGQGVLRPSLPYMVMELVSGRALSELAPELDWNALRNALVSLLDALAHAHARGVVHRDLKPHNVMVAHERVKLTDFGIALATGTGSTSRVTRREDTGGTGTPHYMAPEQITGVWQDQGPWTDLYALGCLTWAMVTGRPPHDADTVMGVLIAQVNDALPDLHPTMRVPAGFEVWVRRLLEKEPERRFRRAADAAWALLALSPSPTSEPGTDDPGDTLIERPVGGLAETIRIPAALRAINWTSRDRLALNVHSTTEEMRQVRPGVDFAPTPPVPENWRRPASEALRYALAGGLRLFGLRSLPVVGRVVERDVLWGALRDTCVEGTPRVVSVHGPTGCGKSRLVEWLAERAHELGVATALRAEHGPRAGDGDGVRPMLRRHFRADEMDQALLEERVDRFLTVRGVDSVGARERLVSLLGDDTDEVVTDRGRSAVMRFASPRERHAVVRHVLELLTDERPIVLWLDNVQWGHDALVFVTSLLEADIRRPILVVLTYADEALADRATEAELTAALSRRDHARDVPLALLDVDDRRELTRDVLRLDPELAEQVEARAGGNPMFVVQLVADWVQRERLEPGPHGLRLVGDVDRDLPDSLLAVWGERVEGLLYEHSHDERVALELAAVMGTQIDTAEWTAACGLLGVAPCAALVQTLLREGLVAGVVAGLDADALRSGWRFSHGLLVEALRRRSSDAGRLKPAHLAAAEALAARSTPANAGRRAAHRHAAGEFAESLRPYLEATRWALEAGELREAERLLDCREAALDLLEAPASSAARVADWLLRSEVAMLRGWWSESEEWARRATAGATEGAWLDLAIEAVLAQARTAQMTGRLAAAWRHAEDAESWARTNFEHHLLARALQLKGGVMQARGALDSAEACYREALGLFATEGDVLRRAQCVDGLGQIALAAGRWDDAEIELSAARQLFVECGSGVRVAHTTNALGEVARHRGELEQAEDFYLEALDRYGGLGGIDEVAPTVNLGLVRLARGQLGEARPVFEAALTEAEQRGMRTLLGVLHAALLPCAIAEGDRQAFRTHLQQATRICDETGLIDRDVAEAAARAGDLARDAGDLESARAAWLLARDHLRGLGRPEETAAIDERLDAARA